MPPFFSPAMKYTTKNSGDEDRPRSFSLYSYRKNDKSLLN